MRGAVAASRYHPSLLHPCCTSWAGIGYGLYLTLSSWALYYVATHTDFFDGSIGMFSLQETGVSFGTCYMCWHRAPSSAPPQPSPPPPPHPLPQLCVAVQDALSEWCQPFILNNFASRLTPAPPTGNFQPVPGPSILYAPATEVRIP